MGYVYSKYLINKKIKNKDVFYNLLLRNYIELDFDTAKKLKNINNNLDNIDFFINEGILVKKDFSEKNLYYYITNKIKYTNYTLSITDTVTLDCNLECSYCMRQNTYKSEHIVPQSPEKKIEVWKKLLELLHSEEIVVTFFGGEPSLYPKYISSMIERSEKLNLPVKNFNLISNGVSYSEKMIDVLKSNKIKFVQITIDGPKEIHNLRRKSENINNSWDYIINTIKIILEKTTSIIILHSVIDNINFYEGHSKMLEDLINIFGITALKKKFIFNIGLLSHPDGFCSYTKKNIPSLEKYGKIYLETLKNILEKNLNVVDFLNVWPCTYNKEGDIVIAPNGDLYNCISGIGIDKFKICTYDEIINKPENFLRKYSQFLENKFTDELCEDCKYLPICNGGCRYNIYINKAKKDCWKAFHNKVYEELLSLYFKYKEQVKI